MEQPIKSALSHKRAAGSGGARLEMPSVGSFLRQWEAAGGRLRSCEDDVIVSRLSLAFYLSLSLYIELYIYMTLGGML